MKKAKQLVVLLGVVVPLLYGCGSEQLQAKPALIIEIRDARTGAPAVFDAIVTVRDGAFVEVRHGIAGAPPEMRDKAVGSPEVWAAYNRAGAYDVTITHPNYQTWHRAGIHVGWSKERNPFNNAPVPDQVRVHAQLQPLDGQ
jgi:hypothetical protein